MRLFYILITTFALTCALSAQDSLTSIKITLDELRLNMRKGNSREVAYTNKEAGVLYTETNGKHRSGWQGWRIMSQEILEDYFFLSNGAELERSEATAQVFPHQFIRRYPAGETETVTLADSIDAIIVQLENLTGTSISLLPFFSDIQSSDQCEISFEQNTFLVARTRHLSRTAKENYPVWLGITSVSPSWNPANRKKDNTFSPAEIAAPITQGKTLFILAAGDTKEQVIAIGNKVSSNARTAIAKRRDRMETLLNYSYIRTANKRFDVALHWAKLSLDALIMNQGKKGIFAGLPWFDNYWGRDTYISLPGATLVTGNFSDARAILQSFAEWQDTNSASTNYGRVPNIVTTNSIAYNTADGTPRFVIQLYDYFKYAADTQFLKQMYHVVKRSIEGTLKYHTDSLYFLTHADADTWMDAVGPNGPWSPRGNRANDIQMLWYKQLNVGYRLAEFMDDTASMHQWGKIAIAMQANFLKYFYDAKKEIIFDHITANGKPDKQLRPNLLFTYPMFPVKTHFVNPFKNLTQDLVFPHGIASLSPNDENFHPYHHYEPKYVPDAAYHNGIVWTWLAGAWIDLATEFGLENLAFQMTTTMTEQIIERGAAGTLSELQDVFPREKETDPRLSGTYSQAWSLAEYIRNCYQSYLGTYINTNIYKTADNIKHLIKNQRLILAPRLPLAISRAEFVLHAGTQTVKVEYKKTKTQLEVNVQPVSLLENTKIDVLIPHDLVADGGIDSVTLPFFRFTFKKNQMSVFKWENNMATLNNKKINPIGGIPAFTPGMFGDIAFAKPKLKKNLAALKGPEHVILTNSDVKRNPAKPTILYSATDPADDDSGSSSYTYPQTSALQKGSLDIIEFSVSNDASVVDFTLHFANLSNPGWHPEYGFQLTFAAIAIDKDGKPNSGSTSIGLNSGYTLEPELAYEHIIYVGGGVRLADSKGKILAEYLPVAGDEKNPLGDVSSKTIRFSMPVKLIGKPNKDWRFSVLVGCQDDHGGAGIGEFRTIERQAAEWSGGGKANPALPNVYDVLLPKK